MNKKMRARIFAAFEERLSHRCSPFRKEARYSIKESIIFKFSPSDGFAFFICLILIDTYGGFGIELAASESGDYPFYKVPNGKPFNGQWRVGLEELAGMKTESGMTGFWQIAKPQSLGTMMKHFKKGTVPTEETVPDEKIVEVVESALETLRQYGIPFFENIADEKGLKIRWHS